VRDFNFLGDLVALKLVKFKLIAESHARPISRVGRELSRGYETNVNKNGGSQPHSKSSQIDAPLGIGFTTVLMWRHHTGTPSIFHRTPLAKQRWVIDQSKRHGVPPPNSIREQEMKTPGVWLRWA
jgi:hypothetical protein